MELKQKIIKVIKKSKLMGFATITTDKKPWVRYIFGCVDKDLTIRFSTFASSRKVKQIKKNPQVHLNCGITNQNKMADYLQIQGIATVSKDKAEREGFWRKEFSAYFSGPNDPNYVVVIVKPYRIEYWGIKKWVPKVWKV